MQFKSLQKSDKELNSNPLISDKFVSNLKVRIKNGQPTGKEASESHSSGSHKALLFVLSSKNHESRAQMGLPLTHLSTWQKRGVPLSCHGLLSTTEPIIRKYAMTQPTSTSANNASLRFNSVGLSW